jgi:hypothetical protein
VRVAEHGADVFLRGLAPVILFSGHVGRLTAGRFIKSEAETGFRPQIQRFSMRLGD